MGNVRKGPSSNARVHFSPFPAAGRALRTFPCSWFHPCHALRPIPFRHPCTSHVFLQGRNFVQGKRGSARRKARRTPVSACISAIFLQADVHFACFLARVRAVARIWGKCTSSCKKSGEVHDHAFEVHVVVHGLWRSAYPAPKARPAPEVRGNAQELEEAHSISRSV